MTAAPAALAELEATEWEALLGRLGVAETYFRAGYLESASLLGQGSPRFLWQRGEEGHVLFPCLVREAPEGLRDVSTPMGYGGPFAVGEQPPVEAFFAAYEAWCAENGVVATFARFHPVLANHRLAQGRWHLERVGTSVAWRVDGRTPDELLAGMGAHHRRVVRKGLAGEVRTTVESGPRILDPFVSLYVDTMRRRGASPFYFFPDEYWAQLTATLGASLVRGDAWMDGELVAGVLALASPPILHYHLGASSERGQALGANHLLFWRLASWAAERGFSVFHLGGGVGGVEDSLYEFKRRFDPGAGLPACLGKAVHDEAAYRRLTGSATVDYAGYFPAYRRAP